jgi:Homeodomain-like domain-containing protein
MNCYPMAAMQRTMKIQEVILRALAKNITWWQVAEIIGISDRQMRRWHYQSKEFGYDGLLDLPLGRPVPNECR